MIDQKRNYCPICDKIEDGDHVDMNNSQSIAKKGDQDEVSFAVLLALVPAMTMTLFNLMGLI